MRARAAAVASEPVADAAAKEQLAGGGSAVGAVLSGFFAAAGASSGVLLGPISVLVGGTGQGARAFDGRIRQPGIGAKRPRGFPETGTIPDAALVGAPTALAAAAVANAYATGDSLRSVVRRGIEAAERAKAPARAALLERFAQVGASALLESAYRRPLLRVASSSEGGLVTPGDLDPPRDIDGPAQETSGEQRWIVTPWAEGTDSHGTSVGRGAVILAVDIHGALAALAYRVAESGLYIEELELVAPLAAVPVRRGVPRLAPGKRLAAPAALALRTDPVTGWAEIVGEPENAAFDPDAVVSPRWIVRRDATSRNVAIERR